ncbi:hypothetical protein CEXT_383811 [Caerostris extrusa]|uniref:Uncharacterized protein n=1 Tax=Caerostris extrusa TaxID=172846 RepID=A0AAV4UJF7_CAEEX|nr:hypothetical protein CEXT_383811 [Caerostris extrusa]
MKITIARQNKLRDQESLQYDYAKAACDQQLGTADQDPPAPQIAHSLHDTHLLYGVALEDDQEHPFIPSFTVTCIFLGVLGWLRDGDGGEDGEMDAIYRLTNEHFHEKYW